MSRLRKAVTLGVATFLLLPRLATVFAQAPELAKSPALTSQRISLDLKGVDILDVLKLLSQKSGLNFVAGRNVSGRITIFVNDVDVWEAFEMIIAANDLAYEQQGNIVTVMMARDYELLYGEKFQERKEDFVQTLQYAKVVQVATVLNQIKSSVGRVVADEATNTLILSDVPTRLNEMRAILKQLDRPTESHVYNLNYAEAEKLKDKLQPLLSPIGTYTFDARTNKVVISDLREVLQKVDRVIQAFDAPDGQVLIDSQIVNVVLNDSQALGIDWQQLFSGIDASLRNNFEVIKEDVSGGALSGASAFKLITAPKQNTQIIIKALKNIGKTETLSNPRIMVSNNQEAKILVGKKEAFVTTTTTIPTAGPTINAPQVQFVDVGTKLFVTPSVKRDGYVQLKVRPEVSSVSTTIDKIPNTIIPIVQTTESETNVLVKSGTTLIIGGLIEKSDDRTDNHVPWLGELPIVGLPFRGSKTTLKKSELVVFLTPQIVLPDGSPYVPPTVTESASTGTGQAPTASMPEVILQDPVPASYRHTVRQRLQAYLAQQFRAASLQKGSVIVSFILSHDGRLVGDGDVTSPQGDSFIHAAKEALNQAQPFPSFPEGSQASEVRFRLAVEYVP